VLQRVEHRRVASYHPGLPLSTPAHALSASRSGAWPEPAKGYRGTSFRTRIFDGSIVSITTRSAAPPNGSAAGSESAGARNIVSVR